MLNMFFFVSSRRRHTRCALVTGVQTCALPIYRDRCLREWRTRASLVDRHVQSLFFNMAKIAASGRLGQGEEAQAFALPDRVEAIVEREGRTDRVWRDRATDLPDRLTVPAGGFMRARDRHRSEELPSEIQSIIDNAYALFLLKKKNDT